MTRQSFFWNLLYLLLIPSYMQSESRTYRDGSSPINTILSKSNSKKLTQNDFKNSYVIKSAGTYLLTEPINYQGTNANSSAILIAASDVILVLNGFSLVYKISDNPLTNLTYGISYGRNTNVNGICILPSCQNVLICNGSIRLFTGNGIQAHGTNQYDENGKVVATQNGTIENIKIDHVNSNNNRIGMSFTAGKTSNGIKKSSLIDDYLINDLQILNCSANFNDNTGILFNTVLNSKIIGCNTNGNGNNQNGGTGNNATGIDLQNCYNIRIKKNNAIGNLYGIYLHQINNYLATNTPISFTSNDDFYTVNCTVSNNKTELNDWGFRDELSPSSSIYTKNKAVNNGTIKDGRGNYYIFFADHFDPFGAGSLGSFTKVTSISSLQGLNNVGKIDNYSIGLAGMSQASSTPGTTPNIITPQTY